MLENSNHFNLEYGIAIENETNNYSEFIFLDLTCVLPVHWIFRD